MKKLIWTIVLFSTLSYSQDYTGFNGNLTVKNNVWTLNYANNNYRYITDIASISFGNVDDAKMFYNDLNTAFNSKEGTFKRSEYTIVYNKKTITISNDIGQSMVVVKKYLKKGLMEIKNSLDYMK